ncbi:MAG: 4'-phosphopantetheinyl transferase [Phycisphaerales bacterium]
MPSARAEHFTADLFPPGVVVGASDAPGDPSSLLTAECAAVASAVPTRRAEFAAGRALARRLLARLGIEHAVLPVGSDRAPIWPEGITGSISHAQGLCVAAVARRADVAALGIDTEPAEPLDEELWPTIAAPDELDRLRSLSPDERGLHARLLFSAKEAVYKCQFPHWRAPLEFTHVSIRFLPGEGWGGGVDRFVPAFSDDARRRWTCPAGIVGRALIRDGWVLAGAWIPGAARGERQGCSGSRS